MKKQYLDSLYDLRASLLTEIDRLTILSKNPRSKCCDNMSGENETEAELRTRRSELDSIDGLIFAYIEIHSK